MTSAQLVDLSKDLAATTREYVAGVFSEYVGRLKSLEERVGSIRDGAKGDKGDPGVDGRDADTSELEALKSRIVELEAYIEAQKSAPVTLDNVLLAAIEEAVKGELEALPKPVDGKDGERGADGRSVTVEDVAPLIAVEVQKAVEALPRPADGRSVTVEELTPVVVAEVTKAVEALPRPVDGKDGANGQDGVGVAGALIDRDGELVLTLSSGVTKSLGRVVGLNGTHGEDGKDGINFDFWSCEITRSFDPETRLVTDRYVQGDRVREVTWVLDAVMIHRGVYQAGKEYVRGDCVAWSGSTWCAKEATSAKPDDGFGARAWFLIVKKGSVGKEGPEGPPGPPGKDGKDGTDRW